MHNSSDHLLGGLCSEVGTCISKDGTESKVRLSLEDNNNKKIYSLITNLNLECINAEAKKYKLVYRLEITPDKADIDISLIYEKKQLDVIVLGFFGVNKLDEILNEANKDATVAINHIADVFENKQCADYFNSKLLKDLIPFFENNKDDIQRVIEQEIVNKEHDKEAITKLLIDITSKNSIELNMLLTESNATLYDLYLDQL